MPGGVPCPPSDQIVLQSAGSLSVAVLALLMVVLQLIFLMRKPRLARCAWSAGISFSALVLCGWRLHRIQLPGRADKPSWRHIGVDCDCFPDSLPLWGHLFNPGDECSDAITPSPGCSIASSSHCSGPPTDLSPINLSRVTSPEWCILSSKRALGPWGPPFCIIRRTGGASGPLSSGFVTTAITSVTIVPFWSESFSGSASGFTTDWRLWVYPPFNI